MTRLTDLLWSDIEPICEKIYAHPFITGLVDGTLPPESFVYYLAQDSHYLRHYGRALALCATKADVDDDVVMFSGHAAGAIAAERTLHAELLAELGSSAAEAESHPLSPTTAAYTNYLYAEVHNGSYAEAVAAVLPCYWVYAKVGTHLHAHGSRNPTYDKWIRAYGGEDFQEITNAVLAVVDRLGTLTTDPEPLRARNLAAARYEWMFWDAAHRREQWPV